MTTKATEEKKIIEDWRKARRRVLCSPASSHSVSIWYFVKRPTGEPGGFVYEKVSRTIRLSSQSFQGQAVHDPGAMPKVVSYQSKTLVGFDKGRRLYGSVAIIDKDAADEFYPIPEDDKPPPFERLVAEIRDQRLYGKRYAFIDDEEAMAKIKPRFLDYEQEAKWDEEDQQEVLQVNADTQIGGPVPGSVDSPPAQAAG